MLLTSNTLKELKATLYSSQNGCCLLCRCKLDDDVQKNHLDHDHALDGSSAGKVRGLLCKLCNPAEGLVRHKFNRSGLKNKVDYLQWLKNLVDYLSEDYSLNDIHPQYMVDIVKSFKRMSKDEMIETMERYSYEYTQKDTKDELVKKFKKQHTKSLKVPTCK